MQQEQYDLLEHKVFVLKPFKQLFNTVLFVSLIIAALSFLWHIFFPTLRSIFEISLSGDFSYWLVILLFWGFHFVHQKMLKKVLAINDFQKKTKEYFKVYKVKLLLFIFLLSSSWLLLVFNGSRSNLYNAIINTAIIIFLRPYSKIISHELKENDIHFE